MRVLSGRRSAVLVALLATILLVAQPSAPRSSRPRRPPGLSRFMYAIGKVESGGNYYRAELIVGRLRQVPDHAVELAVLGAPVPRQRQRQADPGQPGEGRCRAR